MRRILISLAGTLSVLGGPQASAQPDRSLPGSVRYYQQELSDFCVEMGGRAEFGPDFIQRADFDGDGADDYLLDTASVGCGAGGASAGTCGSAGCSVSLFLSSKGFNDTWGGNLQGYEILRTSGQAQLATEMHGSACGQVGAQVCQAVLEWNGQTLARASRRAEATASAASPALAHTKAVPTPPASTSSSAWTYGADGSGVGTARARQAPSPLQDLAVTCENGRPLLAARLEGRPLRNAALTLISNGRRAQIPLQLDARTGVYLSLPAPPHAIVMLNSGDMIDIEINGRGAGALPMAGASDAIASALSPCWRGEPLGTGFQSARSEPVMAEPIPAAVATPSWPPIPEGFYVHSGDCSATNPEWGVMEFTYLTREVWREWDADSPLTGAVHRGAGYWGLTTLHGDGAIEIQVTGPASFQTTHRNDDGRGGEEEVTLRYRHCPTNALPAQVREWGAEPINYEPYEGNG